MSAGIPHEVLSEALQKQLSGRTVSCAVFLTYEFEPDFFELEILPVILPDAALSHVAAVKIAQLEDVLKHQGQQIAVYYDRGALVIGTQSAKLDIKRIPTSFTSGVFHPKNVLLITEPRDDGDGAGTTPRTLITATLSANLTRRGWWENIEVCHIEEVDEGALCSYRNDLIDLLTRVRKATPSEVSHVALEQILAFIRKLSPRRTRSIDGVFCPRLYSGGQSVVDFLEKVAGDRLHGVCLEVISPFFDDSGTGPLAALIDRFSPRGVRVFLPRSEDGGARCSDAVYDAVQRLSKTEWAALPQSILPTRTPLSAAARSVHAKVYRFFDPATRFEILFTGSVNLTTPGHSKGGNFETAVLVESRPKGGVGWWLEVDRKKPATFLGTDSESVTDVTTLLSVRYDWARRVAECYWDGSATPGPLLIAAQGSTIHTHHVALPRTWEILPTSAEALLRQVLESTSFLQVSEGGSPPATILVQEDGMPFKPSVVDNMTAAEILRYWSLLTAEQRAAFLEEHFEFLPAALLELGKDVLPLAQTRTSIFDTFAGYFHAFHTLERAVIEALDADKPVVAEYRLLGQKYDSLPRLLQRLLDSKAEQDAVNLYVLSLCARQLIKRVRREHGDFVKKHRQAFRVLQKLIDDVAHARRELSFDTTEQREEFLAWFEEWFLRRAVTPIGVAV